MPRRRSWSDDEIEALTRIGPRDRAGLAAFRRAYPGHSSHAVSAKLQVLRTRELAADVSHRRRDDPFPKYRFD